VLRLDPRGDASKCWRARQSTASTGRPGVIATPLAQPSQLNAALYRIAITQARYHPAARAYLVRKCPEGKTRREAIRCLKRLLIRVVLNTLKSGPALT
jgi:hypothetical protein